MAIVLTCSSESVFFTGIGLNRYKLIRFYPVKWQCYRPFPRDYFYYSNHPVPNLLGDRVQTLAKLYNY